MSERERGAKTKKENPGIWLNVWLSVQQWILYSLIFFLPFQPFAAGQLANPSLFCEWHHLLESVEAWGQYVHYRAAATSQEKSSSKSVFCLLLSKDAQASCIVPLVFLRSSRSWVLGRWTEPEHHLMSAKLKYMNVLLSPAKKPSGENYWQSVCPSMLKCSLLKGQRCTWTRHNEERTPCVFRTTSHALRREPRTDIWPWRVTLFSYALQLWKQQARENVSSGCCWFTSAEEVLNLL